MSGFSNTSGFRSGYAQGVLEAKHDFPPETALRGAVALYLSRGIARAASRYSKRGEANYEAYSCAFRFRD